MSTLDTLLEYQKSDIELRKILDKIDRSDDNERLERAKSVFNKAKQTVSDSEEQA